MSSLEFKTNNSNVALHGFNHPVMHLEKEAKKSQIIKDTTRVHSIRMDYKAISLRVSIWSLPKEAQFHECKCKITRGVYYKFHKEELERIVADCFGKRFELVKEPTDLSGQLYFEFKCEL